MAGFDGYGMPSVDFSAIGNLGDTFQRARQGAVRERVLSDLGKGSLDYGKASQALLAAGDTEGGLSLARLAEARAQHGTSEAQRREEFAFRKQEAQRAQENANRAFEFQKAQAAEKPQIVWQGPEGEDKVPYVQDPKTGTIRRMQIEGGPATPATPTNPYAPSGKAPTDAQSKDAGYAARMLEAEQILQNPDVIKAAQSYILQGVSQVPGVGLGIAGSHYRQFDQASRNLINAILRRESGAVINPSEFTNAQIQYLPTPNDDAATLAQKAANRRATFEGMASGAGKGFQPRFTFDEKGNLVPTGTPRRGEVKTQAPAQDDDATKYASAVKELRARARREPQAIQQFDEIFGPGSAARELGQQ